MIKYITAFIFYTTAMIGVLLTAFIVYKKTMVDKKGENRGMIKVIDSIAIAPKKMLLVVKVKDERFLIASGAEHTTFLAKLSSEEKDILKETAQFEPEIQNNDFSYKKQHLNNIENQFRQLYMSDDKINSQKPQPQTMNKQDMVKALLKDLNNTTNSNIGSRF